MGESFWMGGLAATLLIAILLNVAMNYCVWPFEKRKAPDYVAGMLCPWCGERMNAVARSEETIHGCYRCENESCEIQPVYRRVDINLEANRAIHAETKRTMDYEAFVLLKSDMDELTVYLRENHADLIGPQWRSSVQLAIYLLKVAGGKLDQKQHQYLFGGEKQ